MSFDSPDVTIFWFDLSATCWFSFLLVYLHSVTRLSADTVGAIFLLGHIVDALATPALQALAERWSTFDLCSRLKYMHLLGSVAAIRPRGATATVRPPAVTRARTRHPTSSDHCRCSTATACCSAAPAPPRRPVSCH